MPRGERTTAVSARFTTAQLEQIDLARPPGQSRSDFIRDAALATAQGDEGGVPRTTAGPDELVPAASAETQERAARTSDSKRDEPVPPRGPPSLHGERPFVCPARDCPWPGATSERAVCPHHGRRAVPRG